MGVPRRQAQGYEGAVWVLHVWGAVWGVVWGVVWELVPRWMSKRI